MSFLDSLVSCRTEEQKGSSGFDDRVLSTFLVEMDGISNDTEVCNTFLNNLRNKYRVIIF